MPVQPPAILKSYFEDGREPNYLKYVDLIDSMGQGDMEKEDYDSNDDGIVNAADDSDTVDGQHASEFAPSGYGLGANATVITGLNLNSIETTGFYRGNNLINGPEGTANTYVFVIAHSTTYTVQEAWSYYDAGNARKYLRRQINGVWEPWEKLYPSQWADVEDKPSSFTPSSHTHPGDDISSPVLNALEADIANEAALATYANNSDRLDGFHATEFHRTVQPIVNPNDAYFAGDEAGERLRNDAFVGNVQEHFNVSSRPSGYSLRGTLVDSYTHPSHLNMTGLANTFYYRSLVSSPTYYTAVSPLTVYTGSGGGLGVELDAYYYVRYLAVREGDGWRLLVTWRSGSGDSIHTVNSILLPGYPMPLHLALRINGTRWSSWGVSGLIRSPGSPFYGWFPNIAMSGLTWTPTRMGVWTTHGGATWEQTAFDYFSWD